MLCFFLCACYCSCAKQAALYVCICFCVEMEENWPILIQQKIYRINNASREKQTFLQYGISTLRESICLSFVSNKRLQFFLRIPYVNRKMSSDVNILIQYFCQLTENAPYITNMLSYYLLFDLHATVYCSNSIAPHCENLYLTMMYYKLHMLC